MSTVDKYLKKKKLLEKLRKVDEALEAIKEWREIGAISQEIYEALKENIEYNREKIMDELSRCDL